MQVNQSSSQYGKQSSIYPYYKPDNIFERDQAYYEQLQRNTRRGSQSPMMGNSLNSQSGQRVPYQQVQTQYQNLPANYSGQQQQGQYGYQTTGQFNSTVVNMPVQSQSQSQNQFDLSYNQASFGQHNEPSSPQFSRVQHSGQNPSTLGYGQTGGILPQQLAYNLGNAQLSSPVNQANYRSQAEQNRKLKQRLDDLINYRDQSDEGSQVKKKHHYNRQSPQGQKIYSQQTQIQSLLEQVKKNNTDIYKYRNAIIQLQKSMNNIQSVDREIYKQLKNLSNRDQELLERATAALARGASRQEVAAILERIIS